MFLKLLPLIFTLSAFAVDQRPDHYTDLVDYVQEAPDQGENNTCLFMASTGAVELLANKKKNIKNPPMGGTFDLSESYLIWAPDSLTSISFFEDAVYRFNGKAVHTSAWPFESYKENGVTYTVWDKHPNFAKLPRMEVPQVETLPLFQIGNKWSTYVLNDKHIQTIKDALWKHKSPVLVNYNDEEYWHVILIVGYDDRIPGNCYDTDPKECRGKGSFYIRDSFGVKVEVRDYDWFRVKGNAAFVVKLK